MVLHMENQHVRQNAVVDPNMVLGAFWGSREGLLGPLGHVLGALWGSRSTREGFQIHLGTVLGLVCSLFAAKYGLGTVLSSFGTSRDRF